MQAESAKDTKGSRAFRAFRAFVFQAAIHKFERLRAQQREAERQAEHLFQTLLHRAFRGELGERS